MILSIRKIKQISEHIWSAFKSVGVAYMITGVLFFKEAYDLWVVYLGIFSYYK